MWSVALVVVVSLGALALWTILSNPDEVAEPASPADTPVETDRAAVVRAASEPPTSTVVGQDEATWDDGLPSDEQLAPSGDVRDNAYPVDLDALRERLPDNLYWRMGAPTDDPDLLRQRAAERDRWDKLFGKVQSGTATEQEIRGYYSHRQKLSEDYLAFATEVLATHGDDLPDRDRGLYELSARMHRDRLAENPRKLEEALKRRDEQEARREAWRGSGD